MPGVKFSSPVLRRAGRTAVRVRAVGLVVGASGESELVIELGRWFLTPAGLISGRRGPDDGP